jgi:hypothetical protein
LIYVIGRALLMPKTTQYNKSAIPLVGYLRNTLGSITYLLKLGGVFHNLTKTLNLKPYKETNTLLGVFNKHHGLNYFGLDY